MYKQAPVWMGLLMGIIVIGFWDTYFTQLGTVPIAFHLHAITASLWIILLGLQAWTINNGRAGLHRIMGKASMLLFVPLIVSFVMIINMSAQGFAAGVPFYRDLGPVFGILMLGSLAGYLILYNRALANRRTVHLHAGYLLATPFLLWESPVSRLLAENVSFFQPTGPDDLWRIMAAIVVAIGMAAVLALVLYARAGKRALPFLVVAMIMSLQMAAASFGIGSDVLAAGFRAYAAIPPAVSMAAGMLLAVLAIWQGWTQPRSPRSAGVVATPAE